MLILRGGGDYHIIYTCVTELQVSENLIDEPLKCLRGILDPEGHIREFEKPKRRDDGCFCDVVRMNRNLMVCFHQICCGEDFPASKLCEVGNVRNGIFVGDGPSVQSTTVATGSPAVFFLRDDLLRPPTCLFCKYISLIFSRYNSPFQSWFTMSNSAPAKNTHSQGLCASLNEHNLKRFAVL